MNKHSTRKQNLKGFLIMKFSVYVNDDYPHFWKTK